MSADTTRPAAPGAQRKKVHPVDEVTPGSRSLPPATMSAPTTRTTRWFSTGCCGSRDSESRQ